jgi:hypothetical protein
LESLKGRQMHVAEGFTHFTLQCHHELEKKKGTSPRESDIFCSVNVMLWLRATTQCHAVIFGGPCTTSPMGNLMECGRLRQFHQSTSSSRSLEQRHIPWTTTTENSSCKYGKGDVGVSVEYRSKTIIRHVYHSLTMSHILMVA